MHPADLPFGQTKLKGHSTFGLPNGMNAVPPTKFTRGHEKEPILPERELDMQCCGEALGM